MPSSTTMTWLTEARAQYFEQRCCPQSQWTTSLLKTQARFYYTTHSSDRLDDDRQFATVCKNSAWPTCGTQGRTSERMPVLDNNTHSQTLRTSAKPPPSPLLRLYLVSEPPYRTSGGGGGSKTLRRAAARALGPSMGLGRPGACLSATRVFCESFDEAVKPATLTFEDIPWSTLPLGGKTSIGPPWRRSSVQCADTCARRTIAFSLRNRTGGSIMIDRAYRVSSAR